MLVYLYVSQDLFDSFSTHEQTHIRKTTGPWPRAFNKLDNENKKIFLYYFLFPVIDAGFPCKVVNKISF